MWFRVFGTNDAQPSPAAVLEFLHGQGGEVSGRFHGDDLGWFRADLLLAGIAVSLERYLTAEDDIRDDLNTWAAWLESVPANSHQGRLMQHMIGTKQLFTVQVPDGVDPTAIEDLCRFLARQTDGVYQVDGRGFFAADGSLLVPEQP